MQAKAYSEVQDSSLVVSIIGDVGEAKSFQSNQQNNTGKKLVSGQENTFFMKENTLTRSHHFVILH